MFKICSNLIHGTRGQLNQINENFASQQELLNRMEKLIDEVHDSRLKAFLTSEYKKTAKNDQLYLASILKRDKISREIWDKLVNLNDGSVQNIFESDRALVNKKSKFKTNFEYFIFLIIFNLLKYTTHKSMIKIREEVIIQ